ncbi:hypothetical protein Y032_0121g982 [Ancylostoma ceylanicum]|uniref:Leucine Rich repeat-containing domain protein n=1 Tax=Ancylostoma ceylanicum TaxID=53326 RepID=A0A016T9M5_9BILA|nr:hypothetical protein Y032_0121g982 [Ancylostoma ceylanicum]
MELGCRRVCFQTRQYSSKNTSKNGDLNIRGLDITPFLLDLPCQSNRICWNDHPRARDCRIVAAICWWDEKSHFYTSFRAPSWRKQYTKCIWSSLIAAGILNNFTVHMIDLRNNQLGSSFTALLLQNNKITAAGMDSVAAALYNTVLSRKPTSGNFEYWMQPSCEAGVQRVVLLAECLADNSSLIHVDLRDNPEKGPAEPLAFTLSAIHLLCIRMFGLSSVFEAKRTARFMDSVW